MSVSWSRLSWIVSKRSPMTPAASPQVPGAVEALDDEPFPLLPLRD